MDLKQHLLNQRELTGTGCWLWTGCRNADGYGRIRFEGRTHNVHRVALMVFRGVNVEGKEVRHTCDNPPCFNPDHLRAGTHAENMRDMIDRNRREVARGERHGRAKLTDQDIELIRISGESGPELARRLGIDRSTVNRIRRREIWAHV